MEELLKRKQELLDENTLLRERLSENIKNIGICANELKHKICITENEYLKIESWFGKYYKRRHSNGEEEYIKIVGYQINRTCSVKFDYDEKTLSCNIKDIRLSGFRIRKDDTCKYISLTKDNDMRFYGIDYLTDMYIEIPELDFLIAYDRIVTTPMLEELSNGLIKGYGNAEIITRIYNETHKTNET